MNGWWKFHRSMDRHAVWSLSDSQFKVWVSILNLANHQDQDWWDGTERVPIKSGSFITSLTHLASYSRTTIKTVRIAIGNLSKIGSIETQIRAQRYTQITLVNASIYRSVETNKGTEEGIPGAQQGHSEGTVGALTEEVKKSEKGKKVLKTLVPVVDKSTPWTDTLDPVRTFLVGIQAPDCFFNPTYWLRIDQWLGDDDSAVAYFDELKKYLAYIASQNGHRKHKDLLRGFRNWLSTCERWRQQDAQRKAARGQAGPARRYPEL